MKKEFDELPRKVQQELQALDQLADEDIDLSDIPETTDWIGAVRGKFYRPVKQQITLRIDADVIAWFRAQTPQRPRLPDQHQPRPPRARAEVSPPSSS